MKPERRLAPGCGILLALGISLFVYALVAWCIWG